MPRHPALIATALALLLSLAWPAPAAEDAAGSPLEMSMLVAGSIEIDSTGKVVASSLDQQDKIPAPLRELLQQQIPHWRFTPVQQDGQPPRSGNWSLYIPGPRSALPWQDPALPASVGAQTADAPDVVAPFADIRPAHPAGGLVLLTPLGGG